MIVTAQNRPIPLRLPASFFFLGEAFFLAFALLFALHPEALAFPRHPLAWPWPTSSSWASGWGSS